MVEDLIYTLGGPWLFTLLLSVVMVVLALVLSVARMKLVGNDDFSGPAPTPNGALIDHSFPFLESLNEVRPLFIIIIYYLITTVYCLSLKGRAKQWSENVESYGAL